MKHPRVGLNWKFGETTTAEVLHDVAKAVALVWEANDGAAWYQKGPITLEVREEWLPILDSAYVKNNSIVAMTGVELKFVAVFPGERQ